MDDDLMTRLEVAYLFGTTTGTIARWAQSPNIPLDEIRDADGRPRYERGRVEALWASGFRYHPRGVRLVDVARTETVVVAGGARRPSVPAARNPSAPPQDDVALAAGTARGRR